MSPPSSTPSFEHIEFASTDSPLLALLPSSRPTFDFSTVTWALQEAEVFNSRLASSCIIESDSESHLGSDLDFPENLRDIDDAADEWTSGEQVIVNRRADEEVVQDAALLLAGMVWLGGLVWVGRAMLGPAR